MSTIVRRVAIVVVPMVAAAITRSVIRRITDDDAPGAEFPAA